MAWKYLEKNLLEQGRGPTTNSIQISCPVQELNPGHIVGNWRVLSPLCHPYSTCITNTFFLIIFIYFILPVPFFTKYLQGCCHKELLSRNKNYYSAAAIPEQGDFVNVL